MPNQSSNRERKTHSEKRLFAPLPLAVLREWLFLWRKDLRPA
jgi:hypothetical protein